MKLADLKVATTVAEWIAQRKVYIVPLVFGFVSKHASEVKSSSTSKRFVAMKSVKVDSVAKVAPWPVRSTTETDLSVEKKKYASMGSCEKSTKSSFADVHKVGGLLKVDLLDEVDVYSKFVDSVGKVICLDSFAKHSTYSRRSSLLAIMHKTLILAVESIRVD